jgi:ribosomal protein S3
MGQKVNPISLRLEKTNRHFDSCWYDDYNYTDLLLRDLKIKNYFKTVLNQIAYPEGRILIENLPKKSNINLFYCNPSNSRRKKKIRFQLQDYKDNKKIQKDKKKGFGKSFFSFPEQKYWNQEKNDTFTLAQQGLEGWKNTLTAPLHLYKKNVQLDGFSFPKVEKGVYQEGPELLQSRKPLYCLSDLTQKKNTVIDTEKGCTTLLRSKKIIAERGLSPKGEQLADSVLPKNKAKDNKQEVHKKTKEYSKIKEIIESNLRIDKQGVLLNPSVDKDYVVKGNPFSYKQAHPLPLCKSFTGGTSGMGDNDINKFLLQFVLNNRDYNKSVEKQDTDKWVVERFFVRYLLAQLYGKFLQNKSVYSQENLRTLYQFRIFFQEKKKKQKPIRDYRDSKKGTQTKYPSLLGKQNISKKVQKEASPQKGITKVNTFSPLKRGKPFTQQKDDSLLKSKILKKRVLPGLYSSNRVYKSHLESFLSKQYNSFFNLHLFRTLIEKQGALFLVQEIIYYLERKMPFRRIKTQILREIPHYKHIKGVRITCSGRVGGRSKKAQRSKTQSVKIGQTPLGVFSSKIDFASKSALTRFGLIGVKVWVCYQ